MVNKSRIANEFLELATIDSLSLEEREIVDCLKKKLTQMGIDVTEDEAGLNIGGNAGNLEFIIPGRKNIPEILFMAHMDTVGPGRNKKPIVDGMVIKSDGTTVLGADDLSGVVCILEAIRVIEENHIEHGDIRVLFTVAEEVGLKGAKNFDFSKIKPKYCFVLDSEGEIGSIVVGAPALSKIIITVKGKASHAGNPEKGIDAIKIAAEAISKIKLGRIDPETTANIGIINGGNAVNIVCDSVTISAEIRSRNSKKLQDQVSTMKKCFLETAKKYGGESDFNITRTSMEFNITQGDDIIELLRSAANNLNMKLKFELSGGISDASIVAQNGIKVVNISSGMENVHTTKESVSVENMSKAVEFIVEIIKSVD